LVFANVPVSQETIDAARTAGVILEDNIPNVVNVVNVKPTEIETTESVETTVHTENDVPQTV
jgi:hypothetical protein